MSELFLFGFNASATTVDDGIDFIASKDDSYFHIQVKTSNAGAAMIWLSVNRDFFMEPPRVRLRENSTSGVIQSAGGLPMGDAPGSLGSVSACY